LKRKKAKKTFISSRFEAKRKVFGSKTKRKYAVLILLRSEAKNLKRKEATKKVFSREPAKRNEILYIAKPAHPSLEDER
jgi:hypothetical protein